MVMAFDIGSVTAPSNCITVFLVRVKWFAIFLSLSDLQEFHARSATVPDVEDV
jgi:hypothetical protein